MKKIFVYTRVSTGLQVEKETQKNQTKEIDEFLATQKVEIIQRFEDLGISGSDNSRPAFQDMLSKIDAVDGVAVYDLDRLTRDFEMGVSLIFMLKNKQKTLYLARTKEVKDFADSSEQLISIIKSWMSEQEKIKIKARQKLGIERYKTDNARWGRKEIAINWKKYDQYLELGLTKTAIAKLMGLSKKTLFRRLQERII